MPNAARSNETFTFAPHFSQNLITTCPFCDAVDTPHDAKQAGILARQKYLKNGFIVNQDQRSGSNVVTIEVSYEPEMRLHLLRLTELGRLGRGWDSYDAEPISAAAVNKSRALLSVVRELLSGFTASKYQPWTIAPMASGGIQLEWRKPGMALEVEVGEGGDFGYLYVTGEGKARKFEESDEASLRDILQLIEKVVIN